MKWHKVIRISWHEFFCKSQKYLNWVDHLSHILRVILNKTLSQSLAIMFEAVIVVGVQRQCPSPEGAGRGLSWSTMCTFGHFFKSVVDNLERGTGISIGTGNMVFEENLWRKRVCICLKSNWEYRGKQELSRFMDFRCPEWQHTAMMLSSSPFQWRQCISLDLLDKKLSQVRQQ